MKNHTVKLLTGLVVLVTAVCLFVFAGAEVVNAETLATFTGRWKTTGFCRSPAADP